MQPQDATTVYLFKMWPWFEANIKRIAFGAVFVAIAVFLISFYSWRQNKKEVDAGQALTQVVMTPNNGQSADAYLKIASDYQGTRAGQRALLQAGAASFTAGQFAAAQTQFQNFLDTYPDSDFTASASLGVATSLEAQGKTDLAFDAYERTVNQSSDVNTTIAAKFALAQIDEQQGKIADALSLYEDVQHLNPNGSLGSEAGLRMMELKTKSPTTPAPTAPAGTFNLSP